MATGDDGAPAEGVSLRCRDADSLPKSEDPDTDPPCAVTAESDPCVASSGAALSFRTYKRRKLMENSVSAARGRPEGTANAAKIEAQTLVELLDRASEGTVFEPVSISTLASHGVANDISDSSRGQWSKIVLEQIKFSFSEGGNLAGCIEKAIRQFALVDSTTIKDSGCGFEGERTTQEGGMCNGFAANGAGCTLNGSKDEVSQPSMNEICLRAFYDVIISGKFNLLCKFLSENFQGSKIDHLLDFGLLNSRMKEGVYEHCPARFSADFEQVWRKLEGVGRQLFSLAKGLEEISRISCCEQLGKTTECTSCREINEVKFQDVWSDRNLKQAEDWSMYRVCTCRCCGESGHGRAYLICDSCEDIYHVSCIEPAVQEVPTHNWYCIECISSGKGLTHKSCAVCERLHDLKAECSGVVVEKLTMSNTKKDSNCNSDDNSWKTLKDSLDVCTICGNDTSNDEVIRECGHSHCPHGKYHERCLTAKQLKTYGPCWYCPSCLCGACLSDRDDDKIVLCDACDHAYHIYCVQPPLTKIPAGKWFCSKCEAGIQAILRVKRANEAVPVKGKRGRKKLEKVPKKRGRKRKAEVVEGVNKVGGGMDMLLNAAKTLNFEENLGAVNINSQDG